VLILRNFAGVSVHHIFNQCSYMIADERLKIGIAIFHAALECQGDKWR